MLVPRSWISCFASSVRGHTEVGLTSCDHHRHHPQTGSAPPARRSRGFKDGIISANLTLITGVGSRP